MRIVYCIAGTRHSGGMERVLANKANWLVEHGHEVVIVTTDQHGELPFFNLDTRIECYNLAINYEDNNGGSFLNKAFKYPFKQLRHRRKLAELLGDLKADVVVSMFCNDASFLPSINDGSAKVLEIHFSRFKRLQYNRKGIWGFTDRLRSAQDLKTAAGFDRFVVLTREDSANWPGLNNLSVISNARSFRADKRAALENKIVIAVGRICHQKGFDRLIDAWRIVCASNNEWKLRIVGSGALESDLRRQIAACGLEGSVEICPASSAEMPGVYSDASVLVMTSRYEGLPMALLEAQACGLPVVSFDCKCGPRDIIRDGQNGYIVPDGDTDMLAKRLLVLMNDDKLRHKMGEKAYIDSEDYSEDRIMQQWIRLFEAASKSKKGK